MASLGSSAECSRRALPVQVSPSVQLLRKIDTKSIKRCSAFIHPSIHPRDGVCRSNVHSLKVHYRQSQTTELNYIRYGRRCMIYSQFELHALRKRSGSIFSSWEYAGHTNVIWWIALWIVYRRIEGRISVIIQYNSYNIARPWRLDVLIRRSLELFRWPVIGEKGYSCSLDNL